MFPYRESYAFHVIPTGSDGKGRERDMYNIPKEQYDFIKLEFVHKEYAKEAGLMLHEYDLVFDETMTNQIEIGGGKEKIIIAMRCHPLAHRGLFQDLLYSIFKKHPVPWTDFKGIKPNIRKDDKEKYHSIAISDALVAINTDKKVRRYSTRYVTFLEMIDHATKKSVSVQVTGSAFDAMPKAFKLLYGRDE